MVDSLFKGDSRVLPPYVITESYRQPIINIMIGSNSMDLTPNFHNQYKEYRVLDAHTEGEPARIILSGIPMVEGTTMMEKKQFFMEHCDYIRTSLCFEPRGHKDMLCVALVEPVHDAAAFVRWWMLISSV